MQAKRASAVACATYRTLTEIPHAAVQEGRPSQLRGYVCNQIVIEHGIVVTTSSRFPVVQVTRIF
jgi:hypothetical protein